MPTAVINGITVAFDDVGTGTNALLLIHGHPFNRSMWRPQLDAIAGAGWRVIVPDLRGYGETTVVPGKTPLSTFASDAAALLDHLGIDSVVIGGLSMGGQIVMEFARQFPWRVRGIVLAATFPQSETEEGKRARAAMAERLVREGMGGYANEVLSKMLAPRSIEALPDVAHQVMTMMLGTNPEGAAAAVRGRAERPAYEETLKSIAVPGLVVVGSDDAFTTREQAELMRRLVKDSELVWLDGIGHMPNLESTEAFNDALVRFLGRAAERADNRALFSAVLVGPPDPEIVELETRLRDAQLSADVAALDTLITDDLVFAGPDGRLATKSQDLEAHASGIVRFREHVPEELRVRRIGSDVAVTSLRARLAVEVATTLARGTFRYTRVWAREGTNQWRVIGGQVSPVVEQTRN